MSIIAISGKINSGKDTIAQIIQYLTQNRTKHAYCFQDFIDQNVHPGVKYYKNLGSNWEIKKFADKLKDIVCLLIGCTREQLEDREFKEKVLGEEWDKDLPYTKLYSDNPKEKLTPRKLLQTIGTDLFRDQLHPDIWINSLFVDYRPIYAIASYNMKGYWKDKFIPCNKEVYDLRVQKHITEEDWKSHGKPIIKYPNWIITDCRFPNEFQAVKDRGGITIRVNRDFDIKVQHSGKTDDFTIEKFDKNNSKHVSLKQGELLKQHPSETALDHITDWDYVIDNDSDINSLIEKVKQILINEKII